MKRMPVVLDLETKHTFREYNDHKMLGISVFGLYDYATDKSQIFTEDEIQQVFPILEKASLLIGFNINGFDMPVLQAYYPGKVSQFHTFDILDDIKDKLQHRIPLNELVFTTLGKKKSGHGLMAIDYYKEKKFDELKRYCLDDVMLTKELFDFGVREGCVYYRQDVKKTAIPVTWKQYLESDGNANTALTLPF